MKRFLIILTFILARAVVAQTANVISTADDYGDVDLQSTDTTSVAIILKSAKDLYAEEKLDSAFYQYNVALDLAQKIESKSQEAEIFYRIAIYHEDTDDYKNAILNYSRASELFLELGNKSKYAKILNFIGYNYINIYSEDKGIEHFLKSLNVYRELNDRDGIGTNLIDIGNLYYDQENYEFAEKYLSDALEIYQSLEDESGISTCYTNLGNITADSGDYEGGLEYYIKSEELLVEGEDDYDLAIIYNNIGDTYIQMKNFSSAHEFFQMSKEIALRMNEKELLSIIYLNLADVNNQERNYNEAIKNGLIGVKYAQDVGMLDYEYENYEMIAKGYEGLNNRDKELEYLKLHYKIKDSLSKIDQEKKVLLFNALNKLEDTNITISDLSSQNEIAKLKYETEKKITYGLIVGLVIFGFFVIILMNQHTQKKKANNLLQFKNEQIHSMNEEIQEQRDDLKQMNATKDKFFSIIAHDLKNPFNSIKGFTELMIENNSEYDDTKKLKFLKIIKESSLKASSLLNNLLIWANTQSGNMKYRPVKLEISKLISDVVALHEIQAINKEIQLINEVDQVFFVLADVNMVNTILRNLISNSIKFTNKGGKVIVKSSFDTNWMTIEVEDDGIGMSDEDIQNLFSIENKNSHVGTANEQGSGLGLILCKDFVEMHGGEITVETKLGEGSIFKFTLPVFNE